MGRALTRLSWLGFFLSRCAYARITPRLTQTNFRASAKLTQFFMDRDAQRKKH
jgi:hypothetical protein